MPRAAREKSITGIYHIMVRGIDKRNIFLSESDYYKFLECMEKAKEKGEFLLLAYCLMTNHVHMLIKEGNEEIGDSIRRINVAYAQYHNKKHDRTGHLFQNRFKSEAVNDENYLLVVMRYIHQNPIKAGITKHIEDYKWSSYKRCIIDQESIVDREVSLGYFSNIGEFIEFNKQSNDDQCLDYKVKKRYTDDELKIVIEDIIEISKLATMEMKSRNELLRKIKTQTEASVRQLERVLNIGRNIIQKA